MRDSFEVDDVERFQRDYELLSKMRRKDGESIEDWHQRVADLGDDIPNDQSDLWIQQMEVRIKKQKRIDDVDIAGALAWERRKQYWATRQFQSGRRVDDRFWKRVDGAKNDRQIEAAQKEIDDLMEEIAARKRPDTKALLDDLRERKSKLSHRLRRLEANRANKRPPTHSQLMERIINTKKGDVFAASKQQAEEVQDLLEARLQSAKRNKTGDYNSEYLHGPERHRGTRKRSNDNRLNTAPDDWHINVKGTLEGKTFDVHIYYPE